MMNQTQCVELYTAESKYMIREPSNCYLFSVNTTTPRQKAEADIRGMICTTPFKDDEGRFIIFTTGAPHQNADDWTQLMFLENVTPEERPAEPEE
jgi:hypothetical protein